GKLAGIGARVGEQVVEGLGRRVGLHHYAEGVAGQADDVGEVGDRVPVDLLHVRHAKGRDGELREGVAVGPGGLGHGRRAVHAAAAGTVLDHQRLAEVARRDLAQLAEIEVAAAARRPRHDQRDRLGRERLRVRGEREQQASGQPQDSCHAPSSFSSADYSRGPRRIKGLLDPNRSDLTAGVAGTGTMGRGIAQVLAQSGARTLVFDAQAGAARKAKDSIAQSLGKLAEKGRLAAGDVEKTLRRIEIADSLDGLAGAHLVVEAIVEDLAAKQALFAALEKIVKDDCILASNTSSLSVTAMAAGCQRPGRVAGYHFFNPVPVMKIVEVVDGTLTEPWAGDALVALARRFGHTPVRCKDTPGFVVNHAGRAYVPEALRVLSEGTTDFATIDRILVDAAGFRLGPFGLMDLVGL